MIESCIDCLWCKINRSKGTLRCIVKEAKEVNPVGNKIDANLIFSHWTKRDGSEKVVKLKIAEIKKESIIWRDIFNLAQTCPSMKSMT